MDNITIGLEILKRKDTAGDFYEKFLVFSYEQKKKQMPPFPIK